MNKDFVRRLIKLLEFNISDENVIGINYAIGITLFGEKALSVLRKILIDGISGH
jgi:hypothetical protein